MVKTIRLDMMDSYPTKNLLLYIFLRYPMRSIFLYKACKLLNLPYQIKVDNFMNSLTIERLDLQ